MKLRRAVDLRRRPEDALLAADLVLCCDMTLSSLFLATSILALPACASARLHETALTTITTANAAVHNLLQPLCKAV